MKKLALLFVAVSLFVASPVMAELGIYFTDGNSLQKNCIETEKETTINNALPSGLCLGYIRGVSDLHSTLSRNLLPKPLFCSPKNATAGQLVKIVIKFLNEHPEIMLHEPASGLVLCALIEAFPCPDPEPSK